MSVTSFCYLPVLPQCCTIPAFNFSTPADASGFILTQPTKPERLPCYHCHSHSSIFKHYFIQPHAHWFYHLLPHLFSAYVAMNISVIVNATIQCSAAMFSLLLKYLLTFNRSTLLPPFSLILLSLHLSIHLPFSTILWCNSLLLIFYK